jgi:diguanylate cyclase (GGDEF)-like protein
MRYPRQLVILYAAMTALFVACLQSEWAGALSRATLTTSWGYVVLSSALWWWLLHKEYLRTAQRQTQLIHDAIHDALTQLTNRRAFLQSLEAAIHRARRNNSRLGLAFIDLDGFKTINDTYGHASGDLLLVAVAQRLTDTVRKGDLVARVGGDEFVVLVEPDRGESCAAMAQRLLTAFQTPFDLDGQAVRISLSIGVAFCPDHALEAGALLTAADLAMYRAKKSGRHGYEIANDQESSHAQEANAARVES